MRRLLQRRNIPLLIQLATARSCLPSSCYHSLPQLNNQQRWSTSNDSGKDTATNKATNGELNNSSSSNTPNSDLSLPRSEEPPTIYRKEEAGLDSPLSLGAHPRQRTEGSKVAEERWEGPKSTASAVVDQQIERGYRGKLMTPAEFADEMMKAEAEGMTTQSMTEGRWDHPRWLLWSVAMMGAVVSMIIIAGRLRKEQQRFDPRMRQTRILEITDNDEDKIGGPFEMEDCNGKKWTHEDFKGRWMWIYFGFSHCPDICPEEMTKMSRVCRQLQGKGIGTDVIQPIFVTVDPRRDSAEVLREYLSDFHPNILGLRGSNEATEAMARCYRVFYAIPGHHDPDSTDYLIDHSIVMYLMNPDGEFCDFTTKEFTWNELYSKIRLRMEEYIKKRLEKDPNMEINPVLLQTRPFFASR